MIIDADAHILPQDAFDYIDGPMDKLRPRIWFTRDGLFERMEFPGAVHVPGTTPGRFPGTGAQCRGTSVIEARLEDYRRLGIDRQFLFPQFSSIRFNYTLDPELATAMAHSWNVSILKLTQKYPRELIGGALVALQDVEGAVREVEWASSQGFGAVILDKVFPVREHCFSEPLGSRPELWPFFKRCEELDLPLFLHNINHGHRNSNLLKYQYHGLELFAPLDGHMSLVSLVTSGLLDQMPGLRFVFTEAGTGFIKPLVERFDSAFERPLVDYDNEDSSPLRSIEMISGKRITPLATYQHKNKMPPSHYFRKNLSFTIETEEDELPEAIDYLGATQFLFATDYPHDDPGGRMKHVDVKLLRENNRITEHAKDLIFSRNADQLLTKAARTPVLDGSS